MANTRDFKSLGVVASDAQQVTEDGERTVGDYYRRTNLSDAQQVAGELFDVNPRTEFLNQKVFNQSSFTDVMDKHGIVGWTNLVNYSPPAIVGATSGVPGQGDFYFCLRDNGPNSFVVDPVTDNQLNPIFWRIIENSEQLRLALADQTPGSEGSRLVGYNNIDNNGGVDEGLTVKSSLDNVFLGFGGLKGFEILASGNFLMEQEILGPPPSFSEVTVFSHFNTLPGNVEAIAKLDGVGDPENFIQGAKITFENPIPTPYDVQIHVKSNNELFVIDKQVRDIFSYDNLLSTSLEIYQRSILAIQNTQRFPTFRLVNFICYRYNP